MAYEGRAQAHCSICGATAAARYDDAELGDAKVTVELEHLDDDTHNIVPTLDGRRCHPNLLLEPGMEQVIFLKPLD